MNREADLAKTIPHTIAAANASPPVEIAIVDYNSDEEVAETLGDAWMQLINGNSLVCARYEGRDYYHMAHARNLSVKISKGDYVCISCTDIIMYPDTIEAIRAELEKGYIWLHYSDRFVGCPCIARHEFFDAGGYDERFEFYGKEDKDLFQRLKRRGASHKRIPDRLSLIYTPWSEKLRNYRLPLTRKQASKRSKIIYQENMESGVLVANEGREWGQWA